MGPSLVLDRTVLDRTHFAECIFLALLLVTAIVAWRQTKARAEWRFAWLGYLALAGMLGRDIWLEHFGFMRIICDFYVLTIVLILGGFVLYSLFASAVNANYYADPYLSPFYSPCLTTGCVHPTLPLIGAARVAWLLSAAGRYAET